MRRLISLLAVLLLVVGVPAAALADDALEEMLQEAGSADFEGSGIVLSMWDGDSAAATYRIDRHNGMAMVSGAGTDLMLGPGMMAVRSGADWYALEVDDWSEWDMSERYSLSEPDDVELLGRPAFEMRVLESAATRARVIVDAESGVPLEAEIFDGDGHLYRMSALVDFATWQGDGTPMPAEEEMELAQVMPSPSAGKLPASAAWYRRADVYAGPEGTIHAFYTDGLFSFSVFESDRGPTPAPFERATVFRVGGGAYRRILTPSQVWVSWNAPDRSYILVGDLPPDHLEAVLVDLPQPGERSFLIRLWRRLFG